MDNLLLVKQPSGENPGGCHSYPLAVRPSSAASNCPVWGGISVQFALERVSSLPWNQCPVCRGTGVQFGAENAIKTAEFAHTVNVSEQTIRKNYSQTGACYGIRPLKVGRHLLWSVQDIAQLLKEGVQ